MVVVVVVVVVVVEVVVVEVVDVVVELVVVVVELVFVPLGRGLVTLSSSIISVRSFKVVPSLLSPESSLEPPPVVFVFVVLLFGTRVTWLLVGIT